MQMNELMNITPQTIRVRMAPSPTGALHIGTARTTIFNWLFARKMGGKFILRMEDTDAERSKTEFERDIIENLRWLGIDWDEGPDIGGAYGPYRQTERTSRYERYLNGLLKEGKAYYCFCTKEELEAERQAQQGLPAGAVPQYNGRCRAVSSEQARERLMKGESAVIRFRMSSDGRVGFDDVIRGRVEFPAKDIGGDFVIAKSISSPLYNFAVVCDDADMAITHIIRGEDHISNTPKQILIQRALGLPEVIYAHLPLILNPDRSKMSKRKGLFAISEYRDAGYLPEALVNFFALLGWHPGDDNEILTPRELIENFSLERIQKGGAVFDKTKLDWINGEYIRRMSAEDIMKYLAPGIAERKWPEKPDAFWRGVIDLERPRMKKLSDLYALAEFFVLVPEYDPTLLHFKGVASAATGENLRQILDLAKALPSEATAFTVGLKDVLERLLADFGKGPVYWPLRVALSGQSASPGPLEIAAVLGKEETMRRVQNAIEKLGT